MGHELLLEILSHKRPHACKYEDLFVETYVKQRLNKLGYTPVVLGDMENIAVRVGGDVTLPEAKNKRVLFSCHTDTVHNASGPQVVTFDANLGVAYKTDKEPLGADDGTGVWLMLEMIERGIPGTYAFHRGEERGCIGSRWIEKNQAAWLKNFDCAIAFDRKDTVDVITHQRGRRTCSDEFATALAKALNTANEGFKYAPSSHGVYTDTANYDEDIAECTNVSVGYAGAHSDGEMQDVNFAVLLLEALCKVDWEALPIKRAAKRDEDQWKSHFNHHSSSSSYYGRRSIGSSGYHVGDFGCSTVYDRERAMRSEGWMLSTQVRALELAKEIVDYPPISMNSVLEAVEPHDLMPYLRALAIASPERALMVMYHGLLYYQYYSRQMMLEAKSFEYEDGSFLRRPTRSSILIEMYDVTEKGVLVRKELGLDFSLDDDAKDRTQIKAERVRRKKMKKARKAAKRARINSVIPGKGTRPTGNPVLTPRMKVPAITPLIQSSRATTSLADEERVDPWDHN